MNNANQLFERLKNKLIVSCQAEGDSPFNTLEGVMMFAQAAVMGGAGALRSEGFEKTAAMANKFEVPIIGLIKSNFEDGYVRITGSFEDTEKIIESGCDIIAVDGTLRMREGLTGPCFIKEIKKRYNCTVMADISSFNDGMLCTDAGADCISTTLSGYTPETAHKLKGPDYHLTEKLVRSVKIPVIAEGRICSPEEAGRMAEIGAWAVVVGTAITRPKIITEWFRKALEIKYTERK